MSHINVKKSLRDIHGICGLHRYVYYAPINGLPQDGGRGGGGNPWEFDFVKLYLGRDFDTHNSPLAG